MEDLYRRASDRQTMGSVVQELRSSLADVEGQLDKFNRNPAERELLVPVPAKLSAMRGVLSVLGLDQAGHAVVRMRDEVDTVLAQSREAPRTRPRRARCPSRPSAASPPTSARSAS
jgi:chemosensory pili system protein ChpA (sensor histidine kinase/response regulator)